MIVRVTRHPRDDTERTETDYVEVPAGATNTEARRAAREGTSLSLPGYHVEYHVVNGPSEQPIGQDFPEEDWS